MVWTCPTCATVVTTPYCARCGERRIEARDRTLRGLLRLLVNALSSVDGRVLRSVRTLVGRPGALTLAWMDGPRKPYLGPFQLFLLANVAFVAVQSLIGANIFSSTLDSHLHHQDCSAFAQRLVSAHLQERSTTLAAFAPVFDREVAFHAKSLVILMTLPFAVLLAILFVPKRRTLAAHLVFAVHMYAFLLFLYCAVLVIPGLDRLRGGAGLESPLLDTALTVLNLSVCAAYLYAAIGRVYGSRGIARLATSLTLAVATLAIALAYRFGLLVLTVYLD